MLRTQNWCCKYYQLYYYIILRFKVLLLLVRCWICFIEKKLSYFYHNNIIFISPRECDRENARVFEHNISRVLRSKSTCNHLDEVFSFLHENIKITRFSAPISLAINLLKSSKVIICDRTLIYLTIALRNKNACVCCFRIYDYRPWKL